MRTIIVSDIKSNSKSVIPYGLHLAKNLETETEILHIVDPRVVHGEYSSLSDSKSITPGHKLSQEEARLREKKEAEKDLNSLLSREVSRLNYPLKVQTTIEEGKLEKEIDERVKADAPPLFIISAEPDKTIFQSKSEIIDAVKNSGAMAIIVPPGSKFRNFEKITLPVDFKKDKIDDFLEVKFLMKRFNPLVNVVSVTKHTNYLNLELKSKAWKKHAKESFLPETVKTNILEGEDFAETLMNYTRRNKPDLLILFQKKPHLLKSFIEHDAVKKILENISSPVFLFYRK